MKLDIERFTTKPFFISLGLVTIAYFAAIRLFQDWLYHLMKIDVRPIDMFASFGEKFSQAEPFEIILYLAGYLIVPMGAYFITPPILKLLSHRHSKLDLESRNQQQKQKESKSFSFLFSFLDFELWRLGMTKKVVSILVIVGVVGVIAVKFPFAQFIDYVQTHSLGHVLWFIATKRIIVTYTLLGLAAVFFVGYYWFLSRRQYPPIPPPLKGGDKGGVWEARLKKLWPLGLSILIIFIFNPNFPIDPHHYNYFVGSVHEVYQGKALLYESSNLYGLFNIYFLIALFKVIPLSFTAFAGVIMVVYVVFFSSLWVFVRKWLNSYALASLALIPIIAIMYFFQTSPTRSALFFPAMSPFRWGLYVVVLFLMLGYERAAKSKYLHWSLFVAACSLFWNFDSGLFLTAAVLGTGGYVKLRDVLNHPSSQTLDNPSPKDLSDPENQNKQKKNSFDFLFSFLDSSSKAGMTLRKIVGVIGEYLGYVAVIFATTNIINKLIFGSWPRWELFFRESKYFSTGIAMYPLPIVGVFEILFAIYAIVLVLAVVRMFRRERISIPLLFLTFHGVFSFIYYIGESSWQILYVVTPPAVLICAYAYHYCLNRHPEFNSGSRNENQKQKDLNSFDVSFGFLDSEVPSLGMTYCRVIRSWFVTFVFFGLMLFTFKLPLEFSQRNYQGIEQRLSSIDSRDQATLDDALYLKERYAEHRIPVMSLNDTKLMMYSGKVNAFDFYYIFTIYFKSEMQKYVDQVLREQPRYIIVGKGEYRNDQVEYFLNGVGDLYQMKKSLKTVDIYQINPK